jgi:hypothetical protein
VDAVDDDKANVFVLAEELGETSDSHVQFDCVHASEHVEVGKDLLNEVVFVVRDLALGRVLSKCLVQPVLLVYVPHFLVELSHAEAALNVQHNSLKFLTLIDCDRLAVACSLAPVG